MKKIILLLVFFLNCFFLQAQPSYCLDSCIALALKQNVEIKNKLLQIDMAKQTKKEAFTKYFPNISANFIGFAARVDGGINAKYSAVIENYNLPPTQVNLCYKLLINKGFITGVTAVQPIFAGGRIFTGNKLANIGIKVEKLQLSLTENEIKRKIEELFFQIISLEEKKKTIDIVSTQLNNIHKDAEVSVKAGLINANDFLKVQLKQQEIESAKIKVENGIRMSKLALRQYTGIPEKDFNIIYDSISMPASPLTYYLPPEEAVNKRIENQLLQCQKEANKLQKQMEIGKYLPSIAIGGSYLYNEMINSKNNIGFVFGIISIPISDWWGGAHAIQKHRLQEKIDNNNYENNIQLLQLEIEQSWNELNEAYMQLQISQLAIAQTQDNLRIYNDRYLSGTITLSNLLEIQTLLQQNQDAYLDAYITFTKKRTYYLQITGQ